MRNIFSTLLFLFIIQFTAQAGGGWPQPKGSGYFKLSQWWIIADQHYTDQGLIDPNETGGIFNTSFYGEYGFTDRLTGIVYAPLFSRAFFNNSISGTTGETIRRGEAINGVGDADVSIKYGLVTKGPVAVSATLTFGLPLGNASGGTDGNLQTGDGEFNQMLQIDVGKGFAIGETNAYANAYAGFNNRTNGFSDEWRLGIEAGVSLFDEKLWLIGRFFTVQSLMNGSSSDDANTTSIFANNSEHVSISPEIAYQFNEKWGVSAGMAYAVSGRIIYAAPSYNFGVFMKL